MSRAGAEPRLIAVAYASYAALGVQSALLGVAWTGEAGNHFDYISRTFRLPLDAVWPLLLASTLAIFMVGTVSGKLLSGKEVGPIVAAGLTVSSLGLVGMALSPSWPLIVFCGWCVSFGQGVLDTSMNTWFAAHHGARLMNWLHASFGVGAVFGPIVIIVSLQQTGSWRFGYGLVAVLHIGAALAYFLTRHLWGEARPRDAEKPESPVTARHTIRLPLVWMGIGMFVVYTGLEMVAGQWAYPLFTESRGISATTAGVWMTLFWLGFTFGRIFFGILGDKVSVQTLMRFAILGGIVGSLLLSWNPWPPLGFLPLVLYSFSTAPIWAMLMLNTQRTLGPDHAPHAIGFQVSAASLGLGVLPAVAGMLARRSGLETVPFVLVFLALAMLFLFELNLRIGKTKR